MVFLEQGKEDSKIFEFKRVCNGFVWFFMFELESTCQLHSQMCGLIELGKGDLKIIYKSIWN